MNADETKDLLRYLRDRAASGEATIEGMRLMLSQRADLDDLERDELLNYFRERLPKAEVIALPRKLT